MTYITYQNPTDYKIIRELAAGSFQEALARGVQAWDGSTIDDDPNVKRSMQEHNGDDDPQKLIRLRARHMRNRIDWADHLAQRIRDAGYDIVVDGPNAVVLAQEVDADFVAEIVRQHGLDMLPHQIHSIVALPPCQGVPLFRAVVSFAGMHVPPRYWMHRADRFVVGAVYDHVFARRDLVVDTLRKAKNRAARIAMTRSRMKEITHLQAIRDEESRVRQEIEERKLAAEAADQAEREAEVERIVDAFT